jgi:hypothetical protein
MIIDRPNYSLEQFQEKYRLGQEEASRLYAKFGPNKVDLDLLMKGKQNHALLSSARNGEPPAKRAYRSHAKSAMATRQHQQDSAGA